MMTNLNKTKEEIIYELVLSLNQGNSYYCSTSSGDGSPRVNIAIEQYNSLVENGIIEEIVEEVIDSYDDEKLMELYDDITKLSDTLNELREMQCCLEDERLEAELKATTYCNHDWKYLNDEEEFAICSKCGVIRR